MESDPPPKPFRLDVHLKNNRLLRRIEELELGPSVAAAAERLSFSYYLLLAYTSFRRFPIIFVSGIGRCAFLGCSNSSNAGLSGLCKEHRGDGDLEELARTATKERAANVEWREDAIHLAELLATEPEWLWPIEALAVRRSRSFVEASYQDLSTLTGDQAAELDGHRLQHRITDAVSSLNPSEMDVICRRFGLGEHHNVNLFFDGDTLEDVAKARQLSRERVRQIEARALRSLRHPYRANWIIGKRCEEKGFRLPQRKGDDQDTRRAKGKAEALEGLSRLCEYPNEDLSLVEILIVLRCRPGQMQSLRNEGLPVRYDKDGRLVFNKEAVISWLKTWTDRGGILGSSFASGIPRPKKAPLESKICLGCGRTVSHFADGNPFRHLVHGHECSVRSDCVDCQKAQGVANCITALMIWARVACAGPTLLPDHGYPLRGSYRSCPGSGALAGNQRFRTPGGVLVLCTSCRGWVLVSILS